METFQHVEINWDPAVRSAARHQHGLVACTVYGDCTVCSCRRRARHQLVLCVRCGTLFRNDKTTETIYRICVEGFRSARIYVGLALKSPKSVLEMSGRHGQTLHSVSVVKQHAVLSFTTTTTTDVGTTCQHALCTVSWSSFVLMCGFCLVMEPFPFLLNFILFPSHLSFIAK
jgi:hypothetical protein